VSIDHVSTVTNTASPFCVAMTVEETPVGKQMTVPLPNGWVIHEPVNLGPTVNSAFSDAQPSLSGDGLTLVFHSNRPGGQGGADLWMCTRTSVDLPFGRTVNLGPTVNSGSHDAAPALSADGLTLLFDSSRPGGQGAGEMWMCKRVSANEPFGEPVNLGPTVNSRSGEGGPVLSADGLTLLFRSSRPGGWGWTDLWVCKRATADEPFGKPVNLGPTVNSSTYDGDPALAADSKTLLFGSHREGGRGTVDLWMCKRASPDRPFGEPVNLGPTVNSRFGEGSPALSADGRMLLFDSNRPGGHGDWDLWMARIGRRDVPAAEEESETISAVPLERPHTDEVQVEARK